MRRLVVALVAEEAAGTRALQLLSSRGHRVLAAFTSPAGATAARASALGVPVRDVAEVTRPQTGEWLREQRAELLLNVHALRIVDRSVLEAPSLGAFNLHPGPLPERAGLHTPSWAIYEGSDWHGVTLHRMTSEVDGGDIAFASKFDIGPQDTGLRVMMRCVELGVPMLERLLECAERGEAIPAAEQDRTRRRRYPSGPPEDGRVGFDRTAREVVNFVRACDYRPFPSPWGFPSCSAEGVELKLLSARETKIPSDSAPGTVMHAEQGAVQVAAVDEWVRIGTVELGGRAVPAAQALRAGTLLGVSG